MGFIDSGSKSSRLLASRRYTHNTFTTAQESFTNVLDLRGEEIYTQALQEQDKLESELRSSYELNPAMMIG